MRITTRITTENNDNAEHGLVIRPWLLCGDCVSLGLVVMRKTLQSAQMEAIVTKVIKASFALELWLQESLQEFIRDHRHRRSLNLRTQSLISGNVHAE